MDDASQSPARQPEPAPPTAPLPFVEPVASARPVYSTELVVNATAPAPATAAPGWYPDQRSGLMRWWDVRGWTENFGPRIQAAPVGVAPKDTAIAYLLLIFLGGLGIHRFYLGRTGTAVTMLVLWLFGVGTSLLIVGWGLIAAVWVWMFVDLFLIPSIVREENARRAI